jgi:hypothetical protein
VGSGRGKSVLLIYVMGGISHHSSFDPRPESPAEVTDRMWNEGAEWLLHHLPPEKRKE